MLTFDLSVVSLNLKIVKVYNKFDLVYLCIIEW